jgi:acetyl esterase/lipase
MLAGLAAGACGGLTACAVPAPQRHPGVASVVADPPLAQADAVVLPNANLVVQGIPPVPRSLVQAVERYAEFRGHAFVDWHPARPEMLLAHRSEGDLTTQLYRQSAPLAAPQRLTHEHEPVTSAHYEPDEGRYIVFRRSSGGDEAFQLHRLDLDSGRTTPLTVPSKRHAFQAWLRLRRQMLVTTLPLDRTAAGGSRAEVQTTLSAIDPLRPDLARTLTQLPGGGWSVQDLHPQETHALLLRYIAATETQIWLLDLADGQRRRLLPQPGRPADARASYRHARFSADGQAVLFTSDAEHEFPQPGQLRLQDHRLQPLTSALAWGVDGWALDRTRRLLVLRSNEDGRDVVRLQPLAADGLAIEPMRLAWPAAPAGTIATMGFDPRLGRLALTLATAQGPAKVQVVDLASGEAQTWTRPGAHRDIDPSRFAPQALVRWPSFDRRMISGWLTRPPERFAGPRPVLIDIHGGPESQARAGFLGRQQYLVQEMGIALLRPNVRGSSGYGKTFLDLDNGRRREDAVRDIGALLDWIDQQPALDPRRVVVSGGSYGGYMSLACAVHHADRLAGAIDVVGISHFVTFLESTESYRRDLRRAEYGDERDPAMREFLHRISPLTHAHRITSPLLVVQGRNDPRVPWTEAEQIVARVRAAGTTVWYLRAENEGHGFARKENADFQFWAQVMFLRQVMQL